MAMVNQGSVYDEQHHEMTIMTPNYNSSNNNNSSVIQMGNLFFPAATTHQNTNFIPSSSPSDHHHHHYHHLPKGTNNDISCLSETLIPPSSSHSASKNQDFINSNLLSGSLPLLFLQRSPVINPWAWGEANLIEGLGSSNRNVDDDEDDPGRHHHNHMGVVSTMKMKKIKSRRRAREPRFCFKTLSDVDVLDDGYRWRKYGQKIVKNTFHPRSYYRCTKDNCSVKKRVERLAEDPRMVITTYEGRHVHSPTNDQDDSPSHPFLNNFFR